MVYMPVEVYRKELLTIYMGFVGLVSVLTSTLYRKFIDSIISLMFTEEHSYLFVVIVSVFLVLYLSFRERIIMFEIRISKMIVASLALTFAAFFYLQAIGETEYLVQYMGLSFSFTVLGLYTLLFTPSSLRGLITYISIFLLTPLPTSILDSLTPALSRLVGRIVSLVTGAGYIDVNGIAYLVVSMGGGETRLLVGQACTGIVTISSILATIPLVLYLLAYGRTRLSKRIIAGALSIAVGLLVGLLGNIIRVILVVEGVKYLGLNEGMALFHYSPSIIYSALSVAIVFYIVNKLGGIGKIVPSPRYVEIPVRRSRMLGLFLLVLLLTSLFILGLSDIPIATSESIPLINTTPEEFIKHPETYILGNFTIVNSVDDPFLTQVLGAFNVRRSIVIYGGVVYNSFIEVVDTPARLHTWQYCLSLQGYNITYSWTEPVGWLTATFIEASKTGEYYTLAYITAPIRVGLAGNIVQLYIRLSILSLGSARDLASKLYEILGLVARGLSYGDSTVGAIIVVFDVLSKVELVILLVYWALIVVTRVGALSSFSKWFKRAGKATS
ncbi:hypothetical protein ACSU1N_01795 [Thermogladius sp. 4427co]|uniref:hypothetical protein n=1 Tax=Thermogladius sp. 4427co TaxID=3450718 RepID=UPI003F7909FF